jgi:hypothetical protein
MSDLTPKEYYENRDAEAALISERDALKKLAGMYEDYIVLEARLADYENAHTAGCTLNAEDANPDMVCSCGFEKLAGDCVNKRREIFELRRELKL